MRAAVIIPTLNEADNLIDLIGQLRSNQDISKIVIVDDGSQDGTIESIKTLAGTCGDLVLIQRSKPMGIGSAIREGLRKALEIPDIQRYVQMDADLSHDPRDATKLLGMEADMIIGSRYITGATTGERSRFRWMISLTANSLARSFLGIDVSDSTSGFRSYNERVARLLSERTSSDGRSFQVEATWLVLKEGLSVKEVPIRFEDRKRGRSKLDPIKEPFALLLFLLKHRA